MKIVDRKKDLLVFRESESGIKFKRIYAAIAWLNPREQDIAGWHWLVVAGTAEDGRNIFLEEHGGTFFDVATAATNAKDRLMIERLYADSTQENLIRDLRQHDGLSVYRQQGHDIRDNPLWLNSADHWPYFRYRQDQETHSPFVVPIISVSDRDRMDIVGGFDRIKQAAKQNRAAMDVECHRLRQVQDEELGRAIEHPLVKAAVWVHSALIRQQEAESHKPTPSPQRHGYWNLKR